MPTVSKSVFCFRRSVVQIPPCHTGSIPVVAVELFCSFADIKGENLMCLLFLECLVYISCLYVVAPASLSKKERKKIYKLPLCE
jgi:hypothetical protein